MEWQASVMMLSLVLYHAPPSLTTRKVLRLSKTDYSRQVCPLRKQTVLDLAGQYETAIVYRREIGPDGHMLLGIP